MGTTKAEVLEVIEKLEKKRFEIKSVADPYGGDRIRALYEHSIPKYLRR